MLAGWAWVEYMRQAAGAPTGDSDAEPAWTIRITESAIRATAEDRAVIEAWVATKAEKDSADDRTEVWNSLVANSTTASQDLVVDVKKDSTAEEDTEGTTWEDRLSYLGSNSGIAVATAEDKVSSVYEDVSEVEPKSNAVADPNSIDQVSANAQ
eukprot:CAMPEP_0170482210 /NCGR_PEP_ID=MMETSP0208-20121228/2329_1 /TAXON_ID=197538 /ORGANISM="Strombidium inclinatum, Strain S3" /LENGTH=153 /DNA_ID=CAMNT_0010755021 /DNA_START=330 /DNA_END=791 /DNA_ORIENTATION=+